MGFLKRKVLPEFEYDPEIHSAVLKCSICNGEQIAGFKDKKTGVFHEISFIGNPAQLDNFIEKYKIDVITKEY